MASVFFHYFLRDGASAEEFEQQILGHVAPRALAEQSVENWSLHRNGRWPGSSDHAPDYICVVEVGDLRLWSSDAAESITESHGTLRPWAREIDMVVSEGGVRPGRGSD